MYILSYAYFVAHVSTLLLSSMLYDSILWYFVMICIRKKYYTVNGLHSSLFVIAGEKLLNNICDYDVSGWGSGAF